jgi:hypothetical protein
MATVTHATKTKTAAKAVKAPAVKKAGKAKAAPAPLRGVHYTITNRPSSGVILFAYTEAALNLLGMYDGVSVEKAKLAKVMGLTAIGYHVNKGTLQRDEDGRYSLTSQGVAFFQERATRAQAAHIDMFTTMMQTGTIAGAVYKNDDQVIAI